MGYIILQLQRFAESLILTVGNHLTISVAGIPFFGFTVPYMAGAYTVAIMLGNGSSFLAAIAAAIGLSGVVGILFALLYRRLSADSFAVFTVASILAFDALLRSWDSVTGGVLGIAGIRKPALVSSSSRLLILSMIIAAACVGIEYLILQSPFGRQLQAHKESPRLLDAAGRSAKRVGSLVILICAATGGIAGIIGAWRIQFLDPSFGSINYFIFGLTICILAQHASIRWMAGATAIVTFVPELLRFLPLPESILGYLRQLMYAVLLIVLVRLVVAKYTETKRIV
jgi:branched-chain amino acid transport system permease protein